MRKKLIFLGLLSSLSFQAQNLILNGSFENWVKVTPPTESGITYDPEKLINWTKSGDNQGNLYKSETMKKEGNYGLEAHLPIYDGKMALRGDNNEGKIENGKTYVYSGWYLDNVPGYVKIVFRHFETDDVIAVEKSENNAEWQYFEIEKVYNAAFPEDEIARVDLTFKAEDNLNYKPVMYLDDFRMIDKEKLSVSDIKDFEKGIKLNTQVKEILNIELPSKSTVNLYDFSGKIIFSKRLDGKNDINLGHLNKGNYILQIRNEQHSVSKKIIKL